MIGPCSWDPPADPPAWLEDVSRPIVLVSTSSEFQDDGRLVTTALEALAGEDVHVVATVPAAELPGGRGPGNRAPRPVPAPHADPAARGMRGDPRGRRRDAEGARLGSACVRG